MTLGLLEPLAEEVAAKASNGGEGISEKDQFWCYHINFQVTFTFKLSFQTED